MAVKTFRIPRAVRLQTGTSRVVSFEIPRLYEAEYRDLVRKAPDPTRLDLEISIPSRPRTTGRYSQGNHFNGHVQQICTETGNDFSDVKLYLKRRAFKRGLRFATKPDGSILYSLTDLEPLPISESDMTTEECAACIEEAHELAAEYGIVLREE